MKTAKTYLPTQRLTYEDIQDLLIVAPRTARGYIKDIREEYDIKVVCYFHFLKYFKL